MRFNTALNNMLLERNNILDYIFTTQYLKEEDTVQLWVSTGRNYSVAGFEITFHRHVTKYIIQYYLTSGLFVVVSWVRTS